MTHSKNFVTFGTCQFCQVTPCLKGGPQLFPGWGGSSILGHVEILAPKPGPGSVWCPFPCKKRPRGYKKLKNPVTKKIRKHSGINGYIRLDGPKIRRSPVDMVVFPIIYRVLAPSQVVGNGISEPSTVAMKNGGPGMSRCISWLKMGIFQPAVC